LKYLKIKTQAETRVLDPRPKLLRFHMPGTATIPKYQIKKRGEDRERKYYRAQDILWEQAEEALSSSSAIFRVQT
jgi:hypothetical protein